MGIHSELPQQSERPLTSQNYAAQVRLRELSTERQIAWIDALFGKLGCLYGSTFASLWAGIPAAEVKAAWQAALSPYTGAQIAWALDSTRRECDVAPTLPRFLRFCAAAPPPEQSAALPDKGVEPSPEVGKLLRDALGASRGRLSIEDRAGWAVRVLGRIVSGEQVPAVCESNAVQALGNLGARDLAPAAYVAMRRSVWASHAAR